MKLKSLVVAACLVAASFAHAQTLQTIKIAPLAQPAAAAAQIDQEALARQKLEADNKKLREENAALQQRVENFINVGGSEVRAYCPTPGTSRNTAGAEANCADAGGYMCEPVSGLCRTSCQTSDMCAGGWTCDTGIQQCVRTG